VIDSLADKDGLGIVLLPQGLVERKPGVTGFLQFLPEQFLRIAGLQDIEGFEGLGFESFVQPGRRVEDHPAGDARDRRIKPQHQAIVPHGHEFILQVQLRQS